MADHYVASLLTHRFFFAIWLGIVSPSSVLTLARIAVAYGTVLRRTKRAWSQTSMHVFLSIYKVPLRTKGDARMMRLHFAPPCVRPHPYGQAWSYAAM